MAETIRLNKVLRELNISLDRAVEFLESKSIEIEKRPTTKFQKKFTSFFLMNFKLMLQKEWRRKKLVKQN